MKKFIYAERQYDGKGRMITGDRPKMRFSKLSWERLSKIPLAIGIEGSALKIKAQGWVEITEAQYYGYKVRTPKEVDTAANDAYAIIERAKNGQSSRDKVHEIVNAIHETGMEIDGVEAMTKKELIEAIRNYE